MIVFILLQFFLFSIRAELENFTEPECVDGALFSIIHSEDSNDRGDQTQANQLCIDSELGELAPLFSFDEFLRAFNLFNLLKVSSDNTAEGIWIGLFDDGTSGLGSNDPLRFSFTNGGEDITEFYFETPFEIPWQSNQPNDDTQFCVRMAEDGLFEDQQCDQTNNDVLCRLSCDSGSADVVPTIALVLSIVGVVLFVTILVLTLLHQRKLNHLRDELTNHNSVVDKTFNT